MRVLGVDLSTCTGLAVVGSDKKLLHSEEVHFKKLSGLPRCGAIAGRVLEVWGEFDPDFAVIENYGFANPHSLVTLVEIGTVVRYFLYQESKVFLVVPPNSLKKFVTGKGNAPKDQVTMHVLKQWGLAAGTNNIADAIGLAMFGLACTGGAFTAASKACCKEVLKGQPEVVATLGGKKIICI